MGRWLILLLAAGLPALARPGQAEPIGPAYPAAYTAWPLGVDFKRAPLGSWAEYRVTIGGAAPTTLTTRWSFLDRTPEGNTLELTMAGPALVQAPGAQHLGKVITRMVLLPDPIGSSKPLKQLVVQIGDRPPVEIPLGLPGLPGHKFQNPDPKKRTGTQAIRTAAGSFTAHHYKDVLPDTVVESWLNEGVPPLGLVKIHATARPGAVGPGGQPLPPVTMELVAHGQGARPAITRAPTRFEPHAAKH